MQIRAQISDESAAQIDDQITDLSNCAFQVIPKELKRVMSFSLLLFSGIFPANEISFVLIHAIHR